MLYQMGIQNRALAQGETMLYQPTMFAIGLRGVEKNTCMPGIFHSWKSIFQFKAYYKMSHSVQLPYNRTLSAAPWLTTGMCRGSVTYVTGKESVHQQALGNPTEQPNSLLLTFYHHQMFKLYSTLFPWFYTLNRSSPLHSDKSIICIVQGLSISPSMKNHLDAY